MVERANLIRYLKTAQGSTAAHSHPLQAFKIRFDNKKQMIELHPLMCPDHFVIWQLINGDEMVQRNNNLVHLFFQNFKKSM